MENCQRENNRNTAQTNWKRKKQEKNRIREKE